MAEQTPKPGWTRVAFGDVVKLNTARCADPAAAGIERYVGLEHIEPEDLRIRRWGLVAEGTTFTNRFQPGQVLFGKRRAYQRKVAVAEFEGVCSSDIYVFESKDDRLLPELLPFLCQTEAFYAHAVGTSAGSLSPRTNWTQLATYEFALPPLEEQRRIAELLGKVEILRNELDSAMSANDRLRQSCLKAVFGDYSQTSEYCLRLQDACEWIGDGTHLPPKFTDSGIPFLLVSNISSGKLSTDFAKWISEESYHELTRSFQPRAGDVLFSLVGSFGVPIYVDWDWRFSFQRHIGIIRTQERVLRGKYLYYFLISLPGKWQAHRLAEGLAQKTITLKSLRSFQIPTPGVSVQDSVIAELEAIERTALAVHERATKVAALKKTALGSLI